MKQQQQENQELGIDSKKLQQSQANGKQVQANGKQTQAAVKNSKTCSIL